MLKISQLTTSDEIVEHDGILDAPLMFLDCLVAPLVDDEYRKARSGRPDTEMRLVKDVMMLLQRKGKVDVQEDDNGDI